LTVRRPRTRATCSGSTRHKLTFKLQTS
jgi:hypothetical protein